MPEQENKPPFLDEPTEDDVSADEPAGNGAADRPSNPPPDAPDASSAEEASTEPLRYDDPDVGEQLQIGRASCRERVYCEV